MRSNTFKREYRVRYYIGNMYHTYIVRATDESDARESVLISSYCPDKITNLTAEPYYFGWN